MLAAYRPGGVVALETGRWRAAGIAAGTGPELRRRARAHRPGRADASDGGYLARTARRGGGRLVREDGAVEVPQKAAEHLAGLGAVPGGAAVGFRLLPVPPGRGGGLGPF
ncbi:hypothetical protein Rxyl_0572 [Rubrobacter xylanophilus DSM 9941]|uniref:Uncharacterized protein n=1 Tax=Rubrobacter xylanophilus (strain DSM 9941 / JCM 11954 / NBRC 16129 / PRD-1) TaxID=266117 RepID=Q1AYI4_RUBXD|nr:hypothetical protein [Rubrobacter xylanophilus]ABG03544.1 hypothetical protein Rxyl_0572 [Rubrobacter xylanophilus DSM 9941]